MSCASRCRLRTKLALNGNVRLHRLSLRFEQGDAESIFAASLHEKLAKAMFVCCSCTFFAFSMVSFGDCWQPSCHRNYSVWLITKSVDMAFIGVSGLVALCLVPQHFFHCLTPACLDFTTVLLACMAVLLSPFTEEFYVSSFLQESLDGVTPPDEAWLLLYIDTIVTVSHVLLPMRWCKLWPLEVTAIFVYPCVAIWSGTFFWHKVLPLVGLVCLSAWGKRLSETREREAFSRVIIERTLRAESEFQLEQSRGQDVAGSIAARETDCERPPCDDGAGEGTPSAPGTGSIFEQKITTANAESALERMATIGRQEHWLIDTRDVEIAPTCVLGGGSFGFVVEGSFRGLPVAVKMSRDRLGEDGRRRVPPSMTEVRVMRQVRHPNVAVFYGAIIDQRLSEVALVLELVSGASLAVHIRGEDFASPNRPFVSECDRFSILLGISSALRHLHRHRPAIVHGDLKPTNILVVQGGPTGVCPKLVDFGLSRVLKGPARPLGGSLPWVAPELVRSDGEPPLYPSVGTDVFSFGRIVFFVAMGVGPYETETLESIRRLLREGEVQAPECEDLSPFEENCWDVGIVCVDMDPTERPGIAEVHDQIVILSRLPELRTALSGSGAGFPPERAKPLKLQAWAPGAAAVRAAHCAKEAQPPPPPAEKRAVSGLWWQGSSSRHSSFRSEVAHPRLPVLKEAGTTTTTMDVQQAAPIVHRDSTVAL